MEYYLGLDIGTDSIGYAVSDTNYNVIKKGKKEFIGIRLFDSGETAADRRGYRSNRRRLQRTKERINLLRTLFDEEIAKVDKNFFRRIDESMYHSEDKSEVQYNSLFNDKNYKDKDYYQAYPTIYHLRKALINGDVSDPRLLYLGLAHIIKNRGHFLFLGTEFGDINNFTLAYEKLDNLLREEEYEKFRLHIEDTQKLEDIIKNRNNGISANEKLIYSLLPSKPTPTQKQIIKLFLGGSVRLSSLFDNLDDELSKKSVCFKSGFEELYTVLESALGDKIILIDMAKAIYDWSVLVDILDCPTNENKETTISDAKIYKYNLHGEDLKLLKKMVYTYIPDSYKEIFCDPNLKSNYATYIGMSKYNQKKSIIKEKICSLEDFSKFVLSKFKEVKPINPIEIDLLERLSKNTAFSKLRTKDNSVIPYQVHKKELDLILKNNSFHFLNNSDGECTVADKIKSIFMFRIPYYVGPLNKHSSNGWIVKNLEEKILPWNFEKVVNLEESGEKFIRKMTNKCTYLKDKDVIPQKSLLYSKFTLLNELNKLKLNGEPISIECKQELYENLFKTTKKVTQNKLRTYLVKNCKAQKDVTITGIDNDFKGSLESYIEFKRIFGQDFNEDMAEDIILWITLFSGEKKMLKKKITSKYKLSDSELNAVSSLKFSGWGRLSREFLTTIHSIDKQTGEATNIIDAMYNTNHNLMELLSKEFDYIHEINKTIKSKDDITLEDIKDSYCSPAVKKSIWQTVQIVKEVEKVMKGKPNKLFIEVTRSEGEKKPTTSRHKDLEKKYKGLKDGYSDLLHELQNKNEVDLRWKKLYLYFTQLGKCVYTGEKIELSDLGSDLFDIEHIYPRSYTKDDSLHNNLVLVKKTANLDKSDKYPIPDKYHQPQLWKLLFEKELITKEKYHRLMRTEEFKPKELEGFIARQLVETSQSTKAVAELFTDYYKNSDTKVCYVKAGNVSDFRQHFKIVKVRDLNDYHHAHDAYLNIVVGNVWDTKFTNQFFKKKSSYSLKPELLYPTDREKYGDYAWEKGNNGTIKTVKNAIANSKILFTRHAFKATGTLFDVNLKKKGNKDLFPAKNSNDCNDIQYNLRDLSKYGGYNSIKGSYFCVVEHSTQKKGKSETIRTIEYVPIYLANDIEKDNNLLDKYLRENLGLVSHRIIMPVLKIGSLLNVDGFPMHLSGRTGDRLVFKGAVQLKLPQTAVDYIKKLSVFATRYKDNPSIKVSPLSKITKEDNERIYDLLTDKLKNSIYNIKLSLQGEELTNKKEVFGALDLETQSRAIIDILVLFKCNPSKANLTLIEGKAAVGTLLMSKNITERKSVKLINQSITGMYENTIDLLK